MAAADAYDRRGAGRRGKSEAKGAKEIGDLIMPAPTAELLREKDHLAGGRRAWRTKHVADRTLYAPSSDAAHITDRCCLVNGSISPPFF